MASCSIEKHSSLVSFRPFLLHILIIITANQCLKNTDRLLQANLQGSLYVDYSEGDPPMKNRKADVFGAKKLEDVAVFQNRKSRLNLWNKNVIFREDNCSS